MDLDWLLLALTPGIGARRFLKLIQTFGSAHEAVAAPSYKTEFLIGKKAALALATKTALVAVERALEWQSTAHNHHLITLQDPDYPFLLAESHSPPALLFAKGRRELLHLPAITIVGSRHATPLGKKTAETFAFELASHGFVIISGLASGIDTSAHQGALQAENHPTIAVIGTGIDRVYPPQNHTLAHAIGQQGLILSEFALGTKPLATNFPRRNRIIAGLSRACIVVEASLNSGSLVTARLALDNNREVMAIPGSIHNPEAHGCHHLIKQGALLIETVEDILVALEHTSTPVPTILKANHSPNEANPILYAMGYDPISVDELAIRLNTSPATLFSELLTQELAGNVASLASGQFQRIR